MKKINIKKDKNYELLACEDVEKWENKELGNDPAHVEKSEFQKTTLTTIRLSVRMVAELKILAKEEGIPYQTLIKSVLTKYIRGRKSA